MLRRLLLVSAGTLILTCPAVHAQDAYKIVVNPANGTSSLTTSELQKLFLDRAAWADGKPVLPVDLSAESPVRDAFSTDVLGMSAASAIERWTSAAAGVQQPLTVATDADVIQYVRLKLGAIGYVSGSADVSRVKVIAIVRQTIRSASSSETTVNNALTAYVTAFRGRDLDALKRIWPAMTAAQMRAIRAEFDHARSVHVEFIDPRVEMKDGAAVVVARRRYAVTTIEGTKLQSETVTTLNLKHLNGEWVIEDVRFQM